MAMTWLDISWTWNVFYFDTQVFMYGNQKNHKCGINNGWSWFLLFDLVFFIVSYFSSLTHSCFRLCVSSPLSSMQPCFFHLSPPSLAPEPSPHSPPLPAQPPSALGRWNVSRQIFFKYPRVSGDFNGLKQDMQSHADILLWWLGE